MNLDHALTPALLLSEPPDPEVNNSLKKFGLLAQHNSTFRPSFDALRKKSCLVCLLMNFNHLSSNARSIAGFFRVNIIEFICMSKDWNRCSANN